MFRILIVDDEQIILNGIRLMIEKKIDLSFPVDIAVANDVEQAMRKVETFRPDLLLTDIRMPVLDGFDLISYVREKKIETSIVILTSHADFQYAQEAIRFQVKDFILKPINMKILKDTIERIRQEKEEQDKELLDSALKTVVNMMLYNLPVQGLISNPEIFQKLFPHTYFTVIVIVLPEVEDIWCESLERKLTCYYDACYCLVWQERRQLIAICNHKQIQHRITPDLLEKELQMEYLCEQMWIAVSISSNDYKMLHSLYLNAVQKIFCSRQFGKNNCLSGLALLTYQDSISVFLENDEKKARLYLEKYLDKAKEFSGHCGTPEEIFRSFFGNIMLYLENNGILVSENLMRDTSVADFGELIPAIQKRLAELKKSMNSLYREDVLIKEMLEYIHQHYSEDISLENLADYVGYNISYISHVFKTKIGQSYLECIHGERLRAAKKLLLGTDYTMEHIAEEVGYNSASQFARVFRRYENVSPAEFRKSNSEVSC